MHVYINVSLDFHSENALCIKYIKLIDKCIIHSKIIKDYTKVAYIFHRLYGTSSISTNGRPDAFWSKMIHEWPYSFILIQFQGISRRPSVEIINTSFDKFGYVRVVRTLKNNVHLCAIQKYHSIISLSGMVYKVNDKV